MPLNFLPLKNRSLKASFQEYILDFKQPAKTSRDTLLHKKIYLLKVWDEEMPHRVGVGECSPLWGLSPDVKNNYTDILAAVCTDIENFTFWLNLGLADHPSIKCGLEMALLNLKHGGNGVYFQTDFTKGEKTLPINGLVWMGDFAYMKAQIEEKIASGFNCIKIKIGGINFEEELALIKLIRQEFSAQTIEIRLDANGSMALNEVFLKLDRLAKFQIHSIEQPIAVKQWETMHNLCKQSPIPIALDEELIGLKSLSEKTKMLQAIQPQYLIFKPTLLGGFVATKEWIDLSNELGLQWWITSALESNIGLNAIAQFVALYDNPMPSGLGTGGLFTNNTLAYLSLKDNQLFFNP